jgi:hypothetical protein
MSGWQGLLNSLGGASENFGNSKFGKGLLNLLQDPSTGDFANGLLAQGGDFAGSVGRSLIDAEKMKILRNERDSKERWLELQEAIQARKLDREKRIASPKSVTKKTTSADKQLDANSRKIVAAFIKKYPQYAGESVEDILAVAQKLTPEG